MAAPKDTRESTSLNAKMPKLTCPKNEINNCHAKEEDRKISKELLVIEHNAVSKNEHIAKLFAKKPAQSANKPREIHRLPQNSVLSQVMSFLPQMKQANDQLSQAIASGADPTSFDIENVDDSAQVIEMNLALVENEGDSAIESECESDDDDSCDSELESDVSLHRPENARKIIEEIDPSKPVGNE